MISKRAANERGHFDHGWLNTYHSFSFSDYYDPEFMGFRHLRVINEDYVQGGYGFGMHPHKDMEIITYILDGSLQHKDSMGNGSTIEAGEVQRMTAGTGVYHSEFNPSPEASTHLLQIWLMPEARNLKPDYEQKVFSPQEKLNTLRLIASRGAEDGSMHINQNIKLFASILEPKKEVEYSLAPDRYAWLQVASGSVEVNGIKLEHGDGAAIAQEDTLKITADEKAEFLLFDLA